MELCRVWHVWGQSNAYKVLGDKPDGQGQLGRPGIGGTIRPKWISKKLDGRAWTGLLWLVQVADCCQHSNEHSVSLKGR